MELDKGFEEPSFKLYLDEVPKEYSLMDGLFDSQNFTFEFPSVINFEGERNLGRLRHISEYGDEKQGA